MKTNLKRPNPGSENSFTVPQSLRIILVALLGQIPLLIASIGYAQGSLTPPGAPSPSMKTLTQIEPRVPISSAPFTISQSGAYYLTTNLSVTSGDAITIATNGVTLDLNGFTISSTEATPAGTAIVINDGVADLGIFNGHIRGGVTNDGTGVYSGVGFGNGVYAQGTAVNVRISRISVSGCNSLGILLDIFHPAEVDACAVSSVGGNGIYAATVRDCEARDCGGAAITAYRVSDCFGECSGAGEGIDGIDTAENSVGTSVYAGGVSASVVINCYGYSGGSGNGISASQVAQSCCGQSLGGAGVYAGSAAHNCVGFGASVLDGVDASLGVAGNCYGYASGSGAGVDAFIVDSCYGSGYSGYGVYAFDQANLSYGTSYSGIGLRAFIANACDGSSVAVTHKYNMP